MSLTNDTTMLVTPATGTMGNGGSFGNGNNDWWILILFLLFGWGRGGWGGQQGGGCGAQSTCATTADVYGAVDQQTLISKLDQQTYGLADSTFALNNTMTTGFSNAELSRCQQQAALMQQLSNMAAESAKCCCENQRSIDGVKFTIAQEDCQTRQTINTGVRDILENANANARAVLDALTANKIEAKNERIAEQQQQIFALQLAASQAQQNQYLVNQLRPCPIPAYITCNPYAAVYSGGCGCNGFAA